MKFTDLKLHPSLQKSIHDSGYESPTPIQGQAIPPVLLGKDLLGCAQTGTGKTAAFALPILQYLIEKPQKPIPKQPRVLVLSPTRELAIQIFESFKTYGQYTSASAAVVFGGVGLGPQIYSLSRGVDILVATPGRLLDLLSQRHVSLAGIQVFVLDEADRMLDMGFLPDIKRVIQTLPQQRQNLFFSATMPSDIQKLADSMLKNPVKVSVAPVSSTAELIQQKVMFVEKSRKKDLLLELLKDNTLYKVIIFCRTKHGANRLSESLVKNGIASEALHGDKSQNARQRALENLRSGKNRVLVATDIAARGIDIDQITHVINYELPHEPESYVHRIGRTARAGSDGIAIAFCDGEEKAYLKDIEKLIGQVVPVEKNHPFHSTDIEFSRPLSKGKAKQLIEGGGKKDFRGPRRRPQGRSGGQGGGGGGFSRHSGGRSSGRSGGENPGGGRSSSSRSRP